MGLKIKLKTDYWEKTRSPEEYKEQMDRWITWFAWIMVAHVVVAIYNKWLIIGIIDGLFLVIAILMTQSYTKYKKERQRI